MSPVYLLLGSNEGDRENWLREGLAAIYRSCGNIVTRSGIYETAAWGIEDQPDFYNMVAGIETDLGPFELLKAILEIEAKLGRQRTVKWGQRILDIDILFYGQEIIHTPDLTIPHPWLQERRFTLAPLAEVIPEFIHPLLHKKVSQLLEDCLDPLDVRPVFL